MTSTLASPSTMDVVHRAPCVIVGGGISGLALAAWLKMEGVEAVVLDKGDTPGGVIGSDREIGFLFERGPNTILDKSPEAAELIELAGLAGEAVRAPMKGQDRYVWLGGKLHKVPTGPGALIGSGLLSAAGKLRLLKEPFVSPVAEDESLGAFVRRRLGVEVYTNLFLPMVQGIWASDPDQLSAAASFPMLKELEAEGGSLVRGMIRRAKTAKRAGLPKRPPASMLSFRDGLQRLPEALAAKLGGAYRRATVTAVVPPRGPAGYVDAVDGVDRVEGDGPEEVAWRIEAAGPDGHEIWLTHRVVLCAEAWTAAKLVEPFDPETAALLAGIEYSPLVSVGLGVKLDSIRLPPGFGFLAARNQGVRVLGAIFNSNFLPGRAPEGCATLTVMLGGQLDPQALEFSASVLMDGIHADLKTVLGWNGQAEAALIRRWERAIPRYGLNHPDLIARVAAAEERRPGLHFFANWREGTSISDRIARAKTLAQRIARRAAAPAEAAPK